MAKLSMCRICLIEDVRLQYLKNINLQVTYQKLTGMLFETQDSRPSHVCYICCAKLRNCFELRTACIRSEELFSRMLQNNTKPVVLSERKMEQIVHTPVLHMNIDPVSSSDDHDANVEDYGFKEESAAKIAADEVYIKKEPFEEQEDIEIEVTSEDLDVSDFSYHVIKTDSSETSDVILQDAATMDLNNVKKSDPNLNTVKFVDMKNITKSINPKNLFNEKTLKTNQSISDVHKNIVDKPSEVTSNNSELLKLILKPSEKKPKCDIFGQCFSAKNNFLYHMRTHTGEKSHKCDICGRFFTTKGYLVTHVRIHTGEKPFECETCKKCFSDKRAYSNHIRKHREGNPKNLFNEKTLKTNQSISDVHKNIVDKPSEVTSYNSELLKLTLKPSEKKHKCDICGQCFSAKSHFLYHMRTHTGEKSYKCDICGRFFSTKGYLVTHSRIHTGEKPFECETCKKCFSDKSAYSKHIHKHREGHPFKCDICGKYYSTKPNLTRHALTHTGEKPFSCATCGKCFIKKSCLARHVRTHTGEKPYSCDTCKKCFKERQALLNHILTHTGEKPHKCHSCGKRFRSKGDLPRHIRTHIGKKPFLCGVCGRNYTTKDEYVSHVRTHSDRRLHKCGDCGMFFSDGLSLATHLLVHR